MKVVNKESGLVLETPAGDMPLNRVEGIKANCVKPKHELRRHERSALRRNLPTVVQVSPHDQEILLIGSGPSLESQIETIKSLKSPRRWICAIKGTHDYLIERGIVPDFALAVDPLERIADLYRKPHHNVQYLIASQCHPSVFEALKDHKVILWHVHTKSAYEYWQNWTRKKKLKNSMSFVGGGSTSGLRSIVLFFGMGFRKFRLFGYDSCLGSDSSLVKITGERNDGPTMVLNVEDRAFVCNGAMLCQANEFLKMIEGIGPDIRIKCYGDGAIPYQVELAAKKNFPQFLLPDEEFDGPPSPLRGSIKRSIAVKDENGQELFVNPDHIVQTDKGYRVKPEYSHWYDQGSPKVFDAQT